MRGRRVDAIWPHEELDVDVGVVAGVTGNGRSRVLSVVVVIGRGAVARMSGRRGGVGIAVATSQNQRGGGERGGRGSLMMRMRMIVISQSPQFNAHNDLSTARDALSLVMVRRRVPMMAFPIFLSSLAPKDKKGFSSIANLGKPSRQSSCKSHCRSVHSPVPSGQTQRIKRWNSLCQVNNTSAPKVE